MKLKNFVNKFVNKLARRTPEDTKVETTVHQRHGHYPSKHGTLAERRTRRKIAHESRRVNFQRGR